MKRLRLFSFLTTLALALALLTGCGGAAPRESAKNASGAAYSMPSAPTAAAADSSNGFYYEAETADVPRAPDAQNRTGSNLPENVKLIYTADISLESTEFDAAQAGLSELTASLGGYFERSELNNYSRYRTAWYVVRVPAENFDAFCSAVGGLGQVNSLNRSAQDVSEAYYDTESRLVTQRTKLERLQALLAQAEEMEDIITLESAISDTELYIESLTGSLRKYDALVGYSTVNVSLSEVYKLTEVEEPVIGFGAKLASAFKTGCSRFVDGLQDLLLGFAYGWVGWLIFIAVVVVVIVVVRRLVRRKRRKDAEAKQAYEQRLAQRRAEAQAQDGEKKDE